ncbi:MAG: 30S ribosomal protein S16 [Candidatus Jorgensenbacteria bacterium]|nr:30S ribosomal protein S16 [Candidatus Jorgensenbacteria bacterium]
MLAIKLKRVGKKGQATFRVVVNEKRSKVQGKFNDDLGWYNPHTNEELDAVKAADWMKKGAQPTETVHNLLVRTGAIKEHKVALHVKPVKAKKK